MPYYFVHPDNECVFNRLLLKDVADWRKESLEFMREAMKEAVRQDGAAAAHDRLFHLFDLLMQEFRIEHNVPGARYIYNPSTGIAFSGGPGQAVPNHYVVAKGPGSPPLETLTRGEFLKRVGDL